MRKTLLLCLVNFLFLQLVVAQPLSAETLLDSFVADLKDEKLVRHYTLVSKQSAIHKMLVSSCMRQRGFMDELPIQG